jgi:flavin-dependent dehydrogenase
LRSEFDALLLAHSGAEVLQGKVVSRVSESSDSVQAEIGGQTLAARYLVGADGAASRIARSLGLRSKRRLGGSLEAEVPLAGNGNLRARYASRSVFALGAIDRGYAWVFPKGDALSVGIVRFHPGRVDLKAALHTSMAALGISLHGVKLRGHPIPCYQAPPWPFWQGLPQEKISTRRCLLVGDAAGLVDPLLGEGIRYAISSARLAAEAIAGDDLSGYDAAVWREIGHSLATAGLAAMVFYHAPRLGYRVGLRNPETARGFVDQFAGRRTYQGIGWRMIWSSAGWVLGGRQRTERKGTGEDGGQQATGRQGTGEDGGRQTTDTGE